ncbi:MAG: hypothetical protein Q9218_006958 [Villophora microphyllina]
MNPKGREQEVQEPARFQSEGEEIMIVRKSQSPGPQIHHDVEVAGASESNELPSDKHGLALFQHQEPLGNQRKKRKNHRGGKKKNKTGSRTSQSKVDGESEGQSSSILPNPAKDVGSYGGHGDDPKPSTRDASSSDKNKAADASLKKRYEVKMLYGKGLGAFATENIKRGTRIMCEKPLFRTRTLNIMQVPAAFAKLSKSDQDQIRTLSHYKLGNVDAQRLKHLHDHPEVQKAAANISAKDQVVIMAIHQTNCFEADDGSVICLDASRINHSCLPNVNHTWNKNIGAETIHAARDIAAGEEPLTTYIPGSRTYDQRKQALSIYGFTCSCKACEISTGHGKASEERRERLLDIDQALAMHDRMPMFSPYRTDEQALDAVLEALKLQQEEGIETQEMSRIYREAAQFSANMGNLKAACFWQEQALESTAVCCGKDHEWYIRDEKTLQDLIKKCPEWRSRSVPRPKTPCVPKKCLLDRFKTTTFHPTLERKPHVIYQSLQCLAFSIDDCASKKHDGGTREKNLKDQYYDLRCRFREVEQGGNELADASEEP